MHDVELSGAMEEKVENKIKEHFSDLISDDAWKTLINKTHDTFVKKELPDLVKSQFKLAYSRRLEQEMEDPDSPWGAFMNNKKPNAAISDIIKGLSEDIVQGMMRDHVMNMTVHIQNELKRQYGSY